MDHPSYKNLTDDEKIDLLEAQAARIDKLEARLRTFEAVHTAQPDLARLYSQALDHAGEAIVLIDHDYRCQFANQVYLDWRGQPATEVIGAAIRDLIGEEQFKANGKTQLKRALAGETHTYEQIHYYKTGTREVIITFAPMRAYNNRITGVVAVLRDMTELKQIQAQLAERERQYKTLIDHFPNGIVALFDQERRFMVVGGQGLGMFDTSPEQVIGKQMHEVFPLEIVEREEPSQWAVLAGETVTRATQNADGRHLISYGVPIRDEAGAVTAGLVMTQDITEQKQVEAALRKSEERYKLISELTSDYTYVFHVISEDDWQVEWVSGAFEKITGYTITEMNGLEAWAKLCHPDDVQAMLGKVAQLIQTGQSAKFTYRIVTKDGQIKTLRGHHRLHISATGTFIHGAAEDITEQKQAEDALRHSEERYKIISELGSDYAAGYIIDENGIPRRDWITDAVERFTGYSVHEHKQLPALVPIHPDDRTRVRANTNHMLATGQPKDTEYRIIHRDGSIRHIRGRHHLIKDAETGQVTYIYLIAQDITEQKQAEDALRESEQRYKIVSELGSDYAAGFRIDEDGTPHSDWISQAIKRFTGYTAEEYEEMSVQFPIHPDDRAYVRSNTNSMLQTGINKDTFYRMIHKDGSIKYVHSRHHLIKDPNSGRVTYIYMVAQDITQRKLAEDTLRESEQRYKIISELGSDYAVGMQVDAAIGSESIQIEWVLGALERILGIDPTDTTHYDDPRALVHPDDREWLTKAVDHMIRTGQKRDVEYRLLLQDGATRHIYGRHHLEKDPETGQVNLIYLVAQDITQRKIAEDARNASEYRYRSLFEQAQDAIFIIDLDGGAMEANTYAAWMLGYSIDELNAMQSAEVVPTNELDNRNVIYERLMAGEVILPYERNFLHKNGSLVPVEVNVQLIYNEAGDAIAIQSIARDLRERKHLQATQRAYDAYFGALMEGGAVGVHVFDADLKTIQANDVVARMLGYTVEEFINLEDFIFLYREDTERILPEFRRLMRGEVDHLRVETRNHHKDGHLVWVDVLMSAVRDDEGQFQYAITIVSDITAQKHAEADQRNLELERQKVKLISEFINTASHEFRTPLSRVNTNLYMLKRVSEDERTHKYIGRIYEESDHILNLVESLLQMVTLEGDATMQVNPVDVYQLLDMIYVDHYDRCVDQGVQLDLQVTICPPIMGHSELLENALHKLMENALAYTSPGDTITLMGDYDETHVILSVQDTGTGISPRALPNIFDRFFRVDVARSTPGFGLGLPIARKIVEQHGGTLTAHSTEGEGSTFTIRLPLSQNEADPE